MTTSIAEHLGIDPDPIYEAGAFNAVLDDDSKYFVDPRLLDSASVPELEGAMQDVAKWFSGVIKLVKTSKKTGDVFWRRAKQDLLFKEPKGICLGYSKGTTEGRGIGNRLADEILHTVKQFVAAGLEDPSLFEFLVVVEKGIGPDRLSDMMARIIYPRFLSFSHRVFEELEVPGEIFEHNKWKYSLPRNPFNGEPIVLVPAEILRSLPSFNSGFEFRDMWDSNADLRNYFNGFLADELKNDLARIPKDVLRDGFIRNAELTKKAIKTFIELAPEPYDFSDDPEGFQLYADKAIKLAQNYPLELNISDETDAEEVIRVVGQIVNQFKELIEENAIGDLLRDKDGSTRKEAYSQKLFFVVAKSYCKANNLAISPETNSGPGCVDFKFGKGYNSTVLVEMKIGASGKLVDGYEAQLPAYETAENSTRSIYLVIDYLNDGKVQEKLFPVHAAAVKRLGSAPDIVIVNCEKRESASKRKLDKSEEE